MGGGGAQGREADLVRDYSYVTKANAKAKSVGGWLEESHLSGYFFLFAPIFWEGGGDIQMNFYPNVNAV